MIIIAPIFHLKIGFLIQCFKTFFPSCNNEAFGMAEKLFWAKVIECNVTIVRKKFYNIVSKFCQSKKIA